MTTEAQSDRTLQNRMVFGVFLMLIALSLYPLSDAFLKKLMGTYPVHQATFLRAITRFIPLFIATFFQGGPWTVLRTKYPTRHILRLAVNLAYTYSFMYALSQGSLTIIYTLSYTSPFFMIVLSSLILKEKINWERWIAVGIGMIGVAIAMMGMGKNITSTTFEQATMIVAILVLVGTFLGALNKILMRRLASTEHSLAIAIYPNVVMILVTLPFLFGISNSWQPMPWNHWAFYGIVGLITAAGQYLIAQALRFTQASVLAPIDYSTFFWVAALDYFWWELPLNPYTGVAAFVIVGSNLYILYRTRREEQQKKTSLASMPNK